MKRQAAFICWCVLLFLNHYTACGQWIDISKDKVYVSGWIYTSEFDENSDINWIYKSYSLNSQDGQVSYGQSLSWSHAELFSVSGSTFATGAAGGTSQAKAEIEWQFEPKREELKFSFKYIGWDWYYPAYVEASVTDLKTLATVFVFESYSQPWIWVTETFNAALDLSHSYKMIMTLNTLAENAGSGGMMNLNIIPEPVSILLLAVGVIISRKIR